MMKNDFSVYLGSSLLILSLSLSSVSCNKQEADQTTLHFTTADGIKTSLDIENEIYTVDDFPGLYYINFKFYKKDEQGRWYFSSKVEGPWILFPDQGAIPRALVLISLSQKNIN